MNWKGLLIAAAAAACGYWVYTPAPPLPDIVLITVDCLRADRVGRMLGDRRVMPSVDDLASRGGSWKLAIAPANWTAPSLASIMTGVVPSEHGATFLGASIEESVPTLAERLRDRGYSTAAFVHAVTGVLPRGIDRGFSLFSSRCTIAHESRPVSAARCHDGWPIELTHSGGASELSRLATTWLASRDGRPRFLWVHYLDPHYPYEAREPFYSLYKGAPAGAFEIDFTRPDESYAKITPKTVFSPGLQQQLETLYDSEVSATDVAIGRLLLALNPATTFVALTADHGEELHEHGRVGHGASHYRQVLQVPLVMAGPGIKPGTKVSGPVEIKDVGVVLRAAARLPLEDRELRLPLYISAKGTHLRDWPPAFAFGEAGEEGEPVYSMVTSRWHMVLHLRLGSFLESGVEVYATGSDPAETLNVADWSDPTQLALARELRERAKADVQRLRGVRERRDLAHLDSTELDRLRKLGYLR